MRQRLYNGALLATVSGAGDPADSSALMVMALALVTNRTPSRHAAGIRFIANVFFAPTLQPLTQLPQLVQCGCAMPATFMLKPPGAPRVTAIGAISAPGLWMPLPLASAFRPSASRRRPWNLPNSRKPSSAVTPNHLVTSAYACASVPSLASMRSCCGHSCLFQIAGSGCTATLALMSEPPPRPLPTSASTPSPKRMSYRPSLLPPTLPSPR